MSERPQWWGHSKEHGWVVLDRDIPCNVPGVRGELMFLRCCDEKIFFLKWELWNPPAYQYAPNYVGTLSGALADEARAELEAVMVRWPELHAELWRQHRDIEDRKAEAHRAEGERQRLAAPGRKKQRGAGPALKVVTAAEE